MLHAYMLTQSGIPVIYSGDEIGQENDYSYHQIPEKCDDSRYLHRGNFCWELAEKRKEQGSVQQKLFDGIKNFERIKANYSVFDAAANVWTIDTWDNSILGIVRKNKKEKLVALFNFSEFDKTAWINEDDGKYTELISSQKMYAKGVNIPAYGVYWLLKKEEM